MDKYFRYSEPEYESEIDFSNIGSGTLTGNLPFWHLTNDGYYYQICNLITEDKTVRLIYDNNTQQIYVFQFKNNEFNFQYDNSGIPSIEIFALFPDQDVVLKHRCQYKLLCEQFTYGDVSISLQDNNSEEKNSNSQILEAIFGEDVKKDDITMEVISPVESDETASEEETDAVTTEAEMEIWTETETSDATEMLAVTTLETIAGNSVETQASTLTETSSPMVSSEKEDENSSILAVLLIVAAALGMAAVGAAGVFFMKNRKREIEKKQLEGQIAEMQSISGSTKDEMTKRIQELQNQNAALRVECDAMQDRIRQKDEKLQVLHGEIQNLTNDAQVQRDSLNHQLQIEKAKNSSGNAEMVAKQAMEIAQKGQQISMLQQQVKELQMKLQSAERNSASEAKVSQKTATSPDVLAKQIALSAQMADQLRDAQYLSVTTSLTGDVMLNTASSYRTAPILVSGTAAMLNPYYYKGFANDREQYENLVHICNIFDVEGLNGSGIGYSLQYIMPAVVRMGTDGTYQIVQKGKLILK